MNKVWIYRGNCLWTDCGKPQARQITFPRGRARVDGLNRSTGPLGAFLRILTWWDWDIDCGMAWGLQLLDGNSSHLHHSNIFNDDRGFFYLNRINYH